ncbi:hypothetical protein, partial [Mesorhizobium sp. M1406]|uniref:hypothetical protein n=1 Tax=Mesorhizobium sp. M1406 TaxID=2957099 RepID=UPI0033352BEA
SRWRRQPAIVKQPENSTFRRSKEWYRINEASDSPLNWSKDRSQVTLSIRFRAVIAESWSVPRSMPHDESGASTCATTFEIDVSRFNEVTTTIVPAGTSRASLGV